MTSAAVEADGVVLEYAHTLHIETEATVDEIRDLIRCQGDSHVMRQTLARTNEYTGERDWSIE